MFMTLVWRLCRERHSAHTWPDSLCGLPQNALLKKFLAPKTSPARCGYLGAFGLDIAA
jgi:hypothetical protein